MKDLVFRTEDNSWVVASFRAIKGEQCTPKHVHDYPHDLFIVKGEFDVVLGALTKRVSEGDTVRFPPDCEHTFVCVSEEGIAVAAHAVKYLKE